MSTAGTMGRRRAALVAVAVCIAAAAGAGEFDPYQVPAQQFAARVRTIALRPIDLPGDAPQPDALRATIAGLIGERLRAKGYEVVAPEVWASTWQDMSQRLGGTYDAVTGESRPEQFRAAFDHTARELERTHGVDAVLSAYVNIGPAAFGRGMFAFETWGQSLRFNGETVGPEIWEAPQSVRGAYLNVVISDLAGTKLYGIRYGIEWTAVYVARGYEERPAAEVYDEPERIEQAVDEDLAPLVAITQQGAS